MYQTSTSKGQELVAQRMVRDFNSLGHKAYLITSVYHDGVEAIQSKSLRKSKGYVFVEDVELGIPVIRVDSYLVKWPRRRISFRDFVQVLEKIVEEFKLNVLITHSTLWNGPEEVAKFIHWRRYMKNLGCYADPIVFCHMSHFQEPSAKHYPLAERTFRMAWNRFSLSQILKTVDLVLVVTPIEKDLKVKMGADPKKCFLFSSGVSEELFLRYAATDTQGFLAKHQIPQNLKLVSYLGTIEERKNPLAILKIAELLKDRSDIHFVIAGRGESSYAKNIKKEASQLPNVSYLGQIEDDEKILLIKSSFINILMSQLEALGLTQLEFMYYGVPIVTSAVGGQSWLVRNGREGLHANGSDDVEGAAKAILNLADDNNLWSKLSANAQAKASNFVSSKIIDELDQAISDQLLKQNGLRHIPSEARDTLTEPEHVLKTWSAGALRVVATNRRLFIKTGRLSRKVSEFPYTSLAYVEHTRRFPWKILLAGFLPSLVILLEPLWRLALKETFISVIEKAADSVSTIIPKFAGDSTLTILFVLVPWVTSILVFTLQARTGFNLHMLGAKPVYMPHGFSEVVTFLRGIQDKQENAELQSSPMENHDLNIRSTAQ
jgi:glycosyltransferase involved in cell wall biosynthesis